MNAYVDIDIEKLIAEKKDEDIDTLTKELLKLMVRDPGECGYVDEDDEGFADWLVTQHFTHIRRMSDGHWIGMQKLMFTMSICVGITRMEAYRYRWCFPDPAVAEKELEAFDHLKHIPTQGTYVAHRYIGLPLVVEYDELGFRKW